jgi:hypothetical protein
MELVSSGIGLVIVSISKLDIVRIVSIWCCLCFVPILLPNHYGMRETTSNHRFCRSPWKLNRHEPDEKLDHMWHIWSAIKRLHMRYLKKHSLRRSDGSFSLKDLDWLPENSEIHWIFSPLWCDSEKSMPFSMRHPHFCVLLLPLWVNLRDLPCHNLVGYWPRMQRYTKWP